MALSIFEGTYLLTEEKTDRAKQERRVRQSSEAKIFHPGLSSMRKERITVDADEQLNLRETMASDLCSGPCAATACRVAACVKSTALVAL